jgi:exodeoxyribonuclease-5
MLNIEAILDDSTSVDDPLSIPNDPVEHKDSEHPFNDDDFEWSDDQRRALDEVEAFVNDDNRQFFGIFGPAGTGKTAVIQQAVAAFHEPGTRRAAMVAPTHQATKILEEMIPQRRVAEVKTLASYLGLKPQFSDGECRGYMPNGIYDNLDDPLNAGDFHCFNHARHALVVVDECSMVDARQFAMIKESIRRAKSHEDAPDNVSVVFMGDPCQLRPVVEDDDPELSPTFEVDHVELEEIVRHEGTIEQTCEKIRNDMSRSRRRTASPDGTDVVAYQDEDRWLRDAQTAFMEGVKAKILCYTNARVDALNDHLHEALHGGDKARWRPGLRGVCVDTFTDGPPQNEDSSIVMYAQQEFEVLEAEKANVEGIDCWELEVHVDGTRLGESRRILALDDDAHSQWKSAYKRAARREDWRRYFQLRDRPFAHVRPPYATTTHKSQGSTYDEVFVDQVDMLDTSFDRETRDRLLYVSHSRASDALRILDPKHRFEKS